MSDTEITFHKWWIDTFKTIFRIEIANKEALDVYNAFFSGYVAGTEKTTLKYEESLRRF